MSKGRVHTRHCLERAEQSSEAKHFAVRWGRKEAVGYAALPHGLLSAIVAAEAAAANRCHRPGKTHKFSTKNWIYSLENCSNEYVARANASNFARFVNGTELCFVYVSDWDRNEGEILCCSLIINEEQIPREILIIATQLPTNQSY